MGRRHNAKVCSPCSTIAARKRKREFARRYRRTAKGQAANARHAALRRSRMAAWPTIAPEALEARRAYYGGRCWLCGGLGLEWDHVKPLAAGGPHLLANLRPVCVPCNRRKGWRWPSLLVPLS